MIKTDIRVGIGYGADDIKNALCLHLPISKEEIGEIKILKKVLKLDGKAEYALSVGVSFSAEREAGLLKMKKKVFECESYDFEIRKRPFDASPVVVGAGPAGLFAALGLAEAGACPIVLERGESVEQRAKTVSEFFSRGILSEESNIQFGEGGAGAFSDGKLKYGAMDKYKHKVLREFINGGAPEDIIYTVGAHLGTDKLPIIVKSIREKIISLGGSFIFSARVCGIDIKDGKLRAITYEKNNEVHRIETDRAVFATGHSAKDTFELLYSSGALMESRGFGIGMRVEHKREYINKLVYGDEALADTVGTASYHLVTHLPSGRSVYSFCMCPGGEVVAAASGNGGIVTNGMSEYARHGDNSNAAILVSVSRDDFGSDHPLAGIELQRQIEREAFAVAGGDYSAPVIALSDFLSDNSPSALGAVKPSYRVGTSLCRPEKYLPDYITESMKAGFADFDAWMPGFSMPDAVLTGPETRSTSPVRVLRGKDFSAVGIRGLYPVGEGAGYAGGIVSSATDGLRAAEAIVNEKC